MNVEPFPTVLSTVRSPCHPAREIPADCQPEPDTFTRIPEAPIELDERLENVREPVRDAWAVVLDSGHHVVILHLASDRHVTACAA